MNNQELIPHLFRTEYRKIVSVLCKHFGLGQIAIAEDIASDTFLSAAQTWGIRGVPPNPVAWIYHVARNKARNYIQRRSIFDEKVSREIRSAMPDNAEAEIDLSEENIKDSQLQMMFAICHPSIPAEAQIGLSLRILCGFGIDEIADAFLTSRDTINKRLFRAREKLREDGVRIAAPAPEEIDARLPNVLTTIYLLFSEGYYSASQNSVLRKDLCLEAMRLCAMLAENASTDKPEVNALLALMCFHASRFEARLNGRGEAVLYADQDHSLWDTALIARGCYHLNRGAGGGTVSKYHIEAAIAYWHTQKADTREKWDSILQLYNQLLQFEYSPIAALNRTFALSKANGREEAIAEAEKLGLVDNHFYYVLLGELYCESDKQKSKDNFMQALRLARTETDRATIQKRIQSL